MSVELTQTIQNIFILIDDIFMNPKDANAEQKLQQLREISSSIKEIHNSVKYTIDILDVYVRSHHDEFIKKVVNILGGDLSTIALKAIVSAKRRIKEFIDVNLVNKDIVSETESLSNLSEKEILRRFFDLVDKARKCKNMQEFYRLYTTLQYISDLVCPRTEDVDLKDILDDVLTEKLIHKNAYAHEGAEFAGGIEIILSNKLWDAQCKLGLC